MTLFLEVHEMRESTTYQAILDEGRVDHARKVILRLGQKHLGEPDTTIMQTIQSIENIDLLDQILDRVLEADSWQATLANE